MSGLIEDLLDISRITLGKVAMHKQVFDLGEMAAECVDAWGTAGRFDPGRVAVDAQPVFVEADRVRMEQVLNNLLDNALKFGGDAPIRVRVLEEDGMARLEVRDGGEGLSPELLETAFDLFVQGSQGMERGRGGLGVGLALVRRLAQLQGGRAWGASDGPGTGAAFAVELPAVAAPRAGADRLAGARQSA
jgi:signal transduction histidine kinase